MCGCGVEEVGEKRESVSRLREEHKKATRAMNGVPDDLSESLHEKAIATIRTASEE